MPSIFENTLKRIRLRYKETVTRPLDFMGMPEEEDIRGYDQLKSSHQETIDAMMNKATFKERVVQVLGSVGGAYVTYGAVQNSGNSSSTLNPLKAALNSAFGAVLSGPKTMLALMMAQDSFELLYNKLQANGEGQHYLQELERRIKDESYSKAIKDHFEKIAAEMLQHFCLREIRLKDANEQAVVRIDGDYMSALVRLVNENMQFIFGVHQDDIEAEQKDWRIWRWISSIFTREEDRTSTTHEIQIGMLKTIGGFHQRLADEKTWIGEHPKKTAFYSSAGGIVIGLLATVFISALATLIWPVVVAAIGGGIIAGVSMYAYAKTRPYKRSEIERNRQKEFSNSITAKESDIKKRFLTIKETKKTHVQVLQSYSQNSHYFTKDKVLKGSAKAWMRTLSKHYAQSKLVENDFAPEVKKLVEDSENDTKQLAALIRQNSGKQQLSAELKAYIGATKTALINDPQTLEPQKLFEVREKVKEQLLEAIALVGEGVVLPPAVESLVTALGGNHDQLELAQAFCPSLDSVARENQKTVYTSLIKKSNQLLTFLRAHSEHGPLLMGDKDYWSLLGSGTVAMHGINKDNLFEALANTKNLLRQLNQSIMPSMMQKDCHSEAFYVFKTLLMRELSMYYFDKDWGSHEEDAHTRDGVNKACKEHILTFVKKTLLGEESHEQLAETLLRDAYEQSIFKPEDDERPVETQEFVEVNGVRTTVKTSNAAFIASCMRQSIAYHPAVLPETKLHHALKAYLQAHQDVCIFGDASLDTLNELNFSVLLTENININVARFIRDTKQLIDSMKQPALHADGWNTQSIDVTVLYQNQVTKQVLFHLKSLLHVMHHEKDKDRLSELHVAFEQLCDFVLNDNYCHQLYDYVVVKQYLKQLREQGDVEAFSEKLADIVHQFNPDEIYTVDFMNPNADAGEDLTVLRRNLKLSILEEVEVNRETLLVNYTPGQSAVAAPQDAGDHVLAPETTWAAICGFFSDSWTPPQSPVIVEDRKDQLGKFIELTKVKTGWFSPYNEVIATGSHRAWDRLLKHKAENPEWVKHLTFLVEKSARQTQACVLALESCKGKSEKPALIDKYIEQTSEFLRDKGRLLFGYNIKEVIREQVIDMIVDANLSYSDVPERLNPFYVNTLGGNQHDLKLCVTTAVGSALSFDTNINLDGKRLFTDEEYTLTLFAELRLKARRLGSNKSFSIWAVSLFKELVANNVKLDGVSKANDEFRLLIFDIFGLSIDKTERHDVLKAFFNNVKLIVENKSLDEDAAVKELLRCYVAHQQMRSSHEQVLQQILGKQAKINFSNIDLRELEDGKLTTQCLEQISSCIGASNWVLDRLSICDIDEAYRTRYNLLPLYNKKIMPVAEHILGILAQSAADMIQGALSFEAHQKHGDRPLAQLTDSFIEMQFEQLSTADAEKRLGELGLPNRIRALLGAVTPQQLVTYLESESYAKNDTCHKVIKMIESLESHLEKSKQLCKESVDIQEIRAERSRVNLGSSRHSMFATSTVAGSQPDVAEDLGFEVVAPQ